MGTQILNRDTRKDILNLEEKMKSLPDVFYGDTDNCPLKHSFADGIYVREIFIPKGTLLVGKIHNHEHPNFLMSGDVSVFTEEGTSRLKGPLSMISKAGTKRVVYAHEDTVWITVHTNQKNTQDLKEIEDFVIAKSYEEFDSKLIESFCNEVIGMEK